MVLSKTVKQQLLILVKKYCSKIHIYRACSIANHYAFHHNYVYMNCYVLLIPTVPAIVENPLSITGLVREQNASFNCTAYGGFLNETVSLVFTWSGPVTINSSDVMTLEHFDFTFTSILTLENATMDYEGNYSCSVAYSDLPDIQSTSETATLTTTSKISRYVMYR